MGMLCINSCNLARRVGWYLYQVYDESELILHIRETIFEAMDDLHRKKPMLNNDDFEELEKSRGLTYSPGSVLLDDRVKALVDPSSQTLFDWPHSVLKGVLPVHLGQFELKLRATKLDFYGMLDSYVKSWHHPGRFAGVTGQKVVRTETQAHNEGI